MERAVYRNIYQIVEAVSKDLEGEVVTSISAPFSGLSITSKFKICFSIISNLGGHNDYTVVVNEFKKEALKDDILDSLKGIYGKIDNLFRKNFDDYKDIVLLSVS
jgi:hypothetical protein